MKPSHLRQLRTLFFVVFMIAGRFASAEAAISNQDCLECHTDLEPQAFLGSAHGDNLCISCHADIKELPHEDTLKPVDCASCHALEAKIYLASDHGRALKKGEPAASCTDCHGHSHTILRVKDPASPVHRANIHKTCAVCHEDGAKMDRYNLLEKSPVRSYAATVHGKALLEKGILNAATCIDCHGSHDLHAPTNPLSKVNRSHVPETCGKCHENILKTYEHSIHGRSARSGKLEAPICTDCHGEHNILAHTDPGSKVYASSISEKVCAQCHAAERITSKYSLPSNSVQTYLNSYHGLASRYGVATVANCASCHGAHDILPSKDPDSSIHKSNLPTTCGKCHANAGQAFIEGSIHLSPSTVKDRAVYWVSIFYIALIVLVIGGMAVHNGLDFAKKWREHYLARLEIVGHGVRFTKSERFQHLFLLLSFFLLAYSGFALKYSSTWWAAPFKWFGTDLDVRGLVHRVSAVVFMGTGVYHLLYLAFTARGRAQIRLLWPGPQDLKDLAGVMRYNLGRQTERPKSGRYGYAEKAEYWALLWGAMVMGVTGLMLWAKDTVMLVLPKWAVDVAETVHFYEAILATLAILVWHLYFVMFDPEHYPMNMSMITGKGEAGSEEEAGKRGRSEKKKRS